MSHTADRPFKCKDPGCSRSFKRERDLKKHETEKHPMESSLEYPAAPAQLPLLQQQVNEFPYDYDAQFHQSWPDYNLDRVWLNDQCQCFDWTLETDNETIENRIDYVYLMIILPFFLVFYTSLFIPYHLTYVYETFGISFLSLSTLLSWHARRSLCARHKPLFHGYGFFILGTTHPWISHSFSEFGCIFLLIYFFHFFFKTLYLFSCHGHSGTLLNRLFPCVVAQISHTMSVHGFLSPCI